MILWVCGGAAVLALVAGLFPPQGQVYRPSPHDRIVLHDGDDRLTLMFPCALCVLVLCASAVAWMAAGLLEMAGGILLVAGGFIVALEAVGLLLGAGGVRR